jgi:hypothetical protein
MQVVGSMLRQLLLSSFASNGADKGHSQVATCELFIMIYVAHTDCMMIGFRKIR